MKVVIFFISLFLGISGYFIRIPTSQNVQLVSDRTVWVRNQRKILDIFKNVCDEKSELIGKDDTEIKFSEELSPETVDDINAIKDIVKLLPKYEIFSDLNVTHLHELRNVYRTLLNAKDLNGFHAVAAWLKQNVNCGLFINAFYAALLNRNDMEKIMIPPPYEILPNYFFKKDIIIKGILILSGFNDTISSDDVQFEGSVYTLDADYTADFYDNDQESRLAYFFEDVGLNTFYFMKHLECATWMYEENPISINGADIYYMLKQLVARYELERYANGFPETKSVNWDSIEVVDYDPMLLYSNGVECPRRSTLSSDYDDEYRTYLKNIEDNIRNLVIHLRQSGFTKSEIVNHLMDILFVSERSYEKVAIRVLKAKDNASPPSALEHYMTKLRDPVYWQIMKKILETTEIGLSVFEEYTRDELFCPGVEILNVEVKKTITYFDFVSVDVTDALKSNVTQTDARLVIQQPRLNHKEFSVKLNILSQFPQKVLVKMYLSPSYQSAEISSKRKKNHMQLHSFETGLKAGNNILTVSSGQMKYLQDFMSLNNLLKKVEDIEYGMDETNLRNMNYYTEFPSHLILPKGSSAGVSVKFLVFVAPIFKSKPGSMSLKLNAAILSPGYPFDSMPNQDILNDLPNAKFKEILIMHKGANKVIDSNGITKKLVKNEFYDVSSRTTYDYASKKGVYDYSSKKDQYSKNYSTSYTKNSTTEVMDKENILEVKPLQVTKTDYEINLESEKIPNNDVNSQTASYSDTN